MAHASHKDIRGQAYVLHLRDQYPFEASEIDVARTETCIRDGDSRCDKISQHVEPDTLRFFGVKLGCPDVLTPYRGAERTPIVREA